MKEWRGAVMVYVVMAVCGVWLDVTGVRRVDWTRLSHTVFFKRRVSCGRGWPRMSKMSRVEAGGNVYCMYQRWRVCYLHKSNLLRMRMCS